MRIANLAPSIIDSNFQNQRVIIIIVIITDEALETGASVNYPQLRGG